jgi:hypothetical protein
MMVNVGWPIWRLKREPSGTATKTSAVDRPTPGIVVSLQQAAEVPFARFAADLSREEGGAKSSGSRAHSPP